MAKEKRRADGRIEKVVNVGGKKVHFYGQSQQEIYDKVRAYEEKQQETCRFKNVAEEWYTQYENLVEHYSYEKSKTHKNRAIEHFGGQFIGDITPRDINQFYLILADKGLARKTVSNQRTVLNNIFKYAIIKGYIKDNPTEFVDLPRRLPHSRREMPSDEDIQRVKDNVSYGAMGLLAYVVLYTGCRRGEALALQYKNIDFINKKVYIDKAVYYQNSMPYIKQPKTEAGTRSVPLLDALAAVIVPGFPEEYIFGGDKPLTETRFKRWWKKYTEDTGLTCTLHQLRHAFCTLMFEAGIDETVAKEIMGHSTVLLMRDIYTHIRVVKIDEAATKLNELERT